jgi:23S rRNA (guanine745-N1)-methyltransferase
MEMKAVLYDRPYENPEEETAYDGFRPLQVVPVEEELDLPGPALTDLFRMTPYAWKTPREGVARLAALDRLTVTAAFRIHGYQRL